MDEEEITPTDPVETDPPGETDPTENTEIDYPTNEDLPPTEDFTNFIVDGVTDDRTLMGTTLHYVFGNVDVMVFIVSVMILATVLIIGTDFMRWKGRE